MKHRVFAALLAFALCGASADAKTLWPALAGTTILIVRHAEKPDSGPQLAPAGVQRAQAYATYFKGFAFDGKHLTPNYIYAAADSKSSDRPRLTCTPTANALNLQIDTRFADKQFAALANDLESTPHGKVVLICWHHGEIPSLVRALGVDPSTVFPAPKWPGDVFGWVVAIHYDKKGHPSRAQLVHENLMPDDAGQ